MCRKEGDMTLGELTKEELISKIEEQERLIQELLQEKERETRLEYAWTGNLGHWYWDILTNQVHFNPLKVLTLGYTMEEVPSHLTYQFFTEKLHPQDYQNTMDAMLNHLYNKSEVYEAEYRIQAKDGTYKWYYDRGKITQYDEMGKPIFLAGIVFDITQKKETQLELENKNRILAEMSSMDGLTQISNHRTVVEFLNAKINESHYDEKALSIAMFDIDNFKKVNDTKGHVFGDKILVDVARIIRDSIRDTDLVGRYGGEEFLVVFPNTDTLIAKEIAERIRNNIYLNEFEEHQKITVSGGVAQYEQGADVDFIDRADQKLYLAKQRGKNQVVSEVSE